jgi:transposase-like protein
VKASSRARRALPPRSAFSGFRFPSEVIVVAVCWYLRYGLSYRDVEELLAERGIEVDHVTVYRWVQRFTPLFSDAARFARHSPGDRWFVDETYVKVNGVWRYVCRTVDQHGQVIDVLVSARRDGGAARRFFRRALATLKVRPSEVVTDKAAVYPRVLDELLPEAWHHVEQYENNRIETDHSRLKHRLRPMRRLRTDHSAQVVIAGLAFAQNLRRGHYELATDSPRSDSTCRRVHRTRKGNLTPRSTRHQPARRSDNATEPHRDLRGDTRVGRSHVGNADRWAATSRSTRVDGWKPNPSAVRVRQRDPALPYLAGSSETQFGHPF